MAAALQIWSETYSRAFDSLPESIQDHVRTKVDEMGAKLANYPHQRLKGRPEFKLGLVLIAFFTNSISPKAEFIFTTSATAAKSTRRTEPSRSCELSEMELIQNAGVVANQRVGYSRGFAPEPLLQPAAEPMSERAGAFLEKSFRQI